MNTKLMTRINQTWLEHFQLPAEILTRRGTTVHVNATWGAGSEVILWTVGEHTVVEMATEAEEKVRQVLRQLPDNHRLVLDDFKQAWGDCEGSAMPMYALDAALFRPAVVPAPFMLRQLTPDDQPVFEAFLAECSADDQDEGDVSIDHMIAFGVFDGARIAATASVFIWRGFIDIGVLSDPAYRGKGLGKAAVSACAAHYLAGDKVVGYRHDANNGGSRGIALGLGFSLYDTVDMVSVPDQ